MDRRNFTLRLSFQLRPIQLPHARFHSPAVATTMQAKEIQRKQSAEEWRTDIGGIVVPTDSPKALMLPMGEDRSATPDAKKRDEASERASERARARTWKERGGK